MSLLDHIGRCNAYDPSAYRPFLVADRPIGAVTAPMFEALADLPDLFERKGEGIGLASRFADPEARSGALAEAVARLGERGILEPTMGEMYRVVGRWGEEPLALLDRTAVSAFGLPAFGVHLNGYRVTPQGVKLWIGRRAMDKRVEPDKLDNMVAGGQPAGLSLRENLVKEAAEEAGMTRDLTEMAIPVGAISYCMAGEKGLKPDTMFVYDLALSEDFVPRNTDGEISRFYLMDAAEILDLLREGQAFKFNVPLVLIDFFIRHGLLSADDEPDYVSLVGHLRLR